jgi:hypothetical protein
VLSAANEEQLRAAQSSIEAVLASLADDKPAEEAGETECATCSGSGKIREGNVDCPDCKGSGKAPAKESRARMLELAEAYSAAADDAGDGAFVLSSLLDLMSDEADEPDELALLQGAFALISQWLSLEVASIGSPDDVDDSAGGDPMDMWWGWEAARKRLKDSGGPIQSRMLPGAAPLKLREAKRLKTDLLAVKEAALRDDGSGLIKIIQPGWGSSGYYSEAVLQRDGPTVFPAGTKMFWDHPTLTEEWERPERSLRDLAGELTTAARWEPNGTEGPGLYADISVFENFAPTVNDLAPSIGVSIRAYGKASMGEAEGRTGQIIDELVESESVDFVTSPGAGGQVLQLFEAARQRPVIPAPKEEAMVEVEKDPKFVEVTAERDRAREALILRDAKDIVAEKLTEAELPDVTKARLKTSLAANPPAKDGALDRTAFEKRIDEAIAQEREYLATLSEAGQIRGMGPGSNGGDRDLTPQLEESFKRLGMSESAAKIAASGRK